MPSAQEDPEPPRRLRPEVLPAVRGAAVEQRAVARLEHVAVAVVVEPHLAREHVEQLQLARLDDHLLRRHAPRARAERGHDRADLALEQPRPQHRPPLGRAVEGDDRVVGLARHDDAALGLAVEERRDRHAEGGRDPAERVERRRQAPRLDLRHHARRQLRLLRQLALLEPALAPQGLDARAERRHATSAAVRPPAPRPPIARRARATNTRVTFLRYGWVKSVLSSGLDGPAARPAPAAITSGVGLRPTTAATACSAGRGSEATAPRTMRASRTTAPAGRPPPAPPSAGRSNEPRRRSFGSGERQPSRGGSRTSATISSRRLARY